MNKITVELAQENMDEILKSVQTIVNGALNQFVVDAINERVETLTTERIDLMIDSRILQWSDPCPKSLSAVSLRGVINEKIDRRITNIIDSDAATVDISDMRKRIEKMIAASQERVNVTIDQKVEEALNDDRRFIRNEIKSILPQKLIEFLGIDLMKKGKK